MDDMLRFVVFIGIMGGYFALLVAIIAGMWKTFVKAGQPGWACIIPIYHHMVLLEIVNKPIWWLILLFFPCLGIFAHIIVMIDLAKMFGKDALFGVGLALLPFIFFPILGFGAARYPDSNLAWIE
jgi:hypothetical protein